jgi:hypothetical protein
MDGGAPATLQAIENATGIGLGEIPATPEKLSSGALAPTLRMGATGGTLRVPSPVEEEDADGVPTRSVGTRAPS